MRKSLVIADYGVGNIGSVQKVLRLLDCSMIVSSDPQVIEEAHTVILPGVGSALSALRSPSFKEMENSLKFRAVQERPLIGLCLGAQIMFDYLEEGDSVGLGIFSGQVRLIEGLAANTGWRVLDYDELRNLGISTGIRRQDHFFFNHSYVMQLSASEADLCRTIAPVVPAVVRRTTSWAVQFHPEKSQAAGVRLLRNILRNV